VVSSHIVSHRYIDTTGFSTLTVKRNKPFPIARLIFDNFTAIARPDPQIIACYNCILYLGFSCWVSAISAFCRPTTQTPSVTNRLVAIVHTKLVIANYYSLSTSGRHLTHEPTTHQYLSWFSRFLPTAHATRSVTIGRIYT